MNYFQLISISSKKHTPPTASNHNKFFKRSVNLGYYRQKPEALLRKYLLRELIESTDETYFCEANISRRNLLAYLTEHEETSSRMLQYIETIIRTSKRF